MSARRRVAPRAEAFACPQGQSARKDDMTDTTDTGSFDRIEPVDIQTEMQRSYIDYAMSVIVGRALPDVRDGLKPVHRKILYGMYDSGFRPDRNFVKCGRVVGDVMGNYHPHGDTALYDALVRMAQPWSLRYPMIDPQGNFGSPGNDPAAAYRYTECRLQQLAMHMLRRHRQGDRRLRPELRGKHGRAGHPAGAASRTCWSTALRASRSAWPRASRRTTCARWPSASPGHSTTRTPRRRSCSNELIRLIPGPGLPDARRSSSDATASRMPTAPAAARSACAPSSTSRRTSRAA